jgi:hypothetical protein
MKSHRRGHVVASVTLAVLGACTALELGIRAFMPELPFEQPAHDVLFLAPERVVGWKLAEHFTFTWTGRNPYCLEFSVPVSTNGVGFRDREWAVDKPPGTRRIALLGDSFIEGIQVPIERTVSRQIESRLQARFPRRRIETLNFGVSNYSVGQYLMVFDEYVRRFQPDYVVVFASYLNFTRTTQRELSSRLQEFYALNVRPSYAVDAQGQLQYVPAADYERYAHSVATLLQTQFGANRTMQIAPLGWPMALPHWLLHELSRRARPAATPHRRTETSFPDVDLNYRILAALNERVRATGGQLVFADAFEYLERYGLVRGSGALTTRNRAFVDGMGAVYVDVSPALRRSPEVPEFECDMHFNETGHRMLAETLAARFETLLEP